MSTHRTHLILLKYSFWFSQSGMKPEILNFYPVPRCCNCCWSMDHIFKKILISLAALGLSYSTQDLVAPLTLQLWQALRLSCSKACGILVLPRIKPMSPALQGGFLTTGPPGKLLDHIFNSKDLQQKFYSFDPYTWLWLIFFKKGTFSYLAFYKPYIKGYFFVDFWNILHERYDPPEIISTGMYSE